jgi:hygromycin-B 4-O-kinase
MLGQLTEFLQTNFDSSTRDLHLLGAGMFSQAYRFDTDAGAFVVRTGVTREAFEKDKLAYERLGHAVQIPQVLAIGEYDDNQFYCISDWQPGRMLTDLSADETRQLLPSLFTNMLAMSQVPVPSATGFGILNSVGQARRYYRTWAEFIGTTDDFWATFTPRGDEIYRPWSELYTTTFLDKKIVQDAHQYLKTLLPLLPTERHYVHGDFGHDNALADGGQLTAILDWAELRCGDWLYDLAYLAYYDDKQIDYIGAFQQWLEANALAIPNLISRIQAYFLHIFLGNIFLEANRNQRDWYEEDLQRYPRLLNSASSYQGF